MFLRYALILLPVCVGIAQDAAPAKTPTWGPRAGPWRLSISAEKSQYSAGETVVVVALLKNVSEQPVLFTDVTGGPPPMLYRMDVRLPVPAWIPWKPRAAELPLAKLQPGASYHMIGMDEPAGWESVSEVDLNKLFDMSTPGDYHVTFSTSQLTRSRADGPTARENPKVTVTSNEITVTVLASGK